MKAREYKIAIDVAEEFFEKKKIFTKNEVYEKIHKRGGVLRVSPGTSIDEWLYYLCKEKGFEFERWTNTFYKK